MPPLRVILPLLALLQGGVAQRRDQADRGAVRHAQGGQRGNTFQQTTRPQARAGQARPRPSPLAAGLGGLTQKLYLQMVQRSGQGNFVYSPLSLHSALSMVLLGTDINSASANELKKVLGVESSRESLGDSYQNLLRVYSKEKSFLYGNAIWVKEGLRLKSSYKSKVTGKLGALVESADFKQARKTVKRVNNWVNAKTNGKIPSIVQNFSPDTPMFLANALYFKEKWKTPFEDARTRTSPFNPLGGNTIQVPMMELASNQTIYREIRANGTLGGTLLAQVATIPYENELFEMQIILPTSAKNMLILEDKMQVSDTIDELEAKYLANPLSFNLFSDVNHLPPQYDAAEVYVKMPPFKVKTDLEANGPLQKLGAKRVFTGQAELGELADGEDLRVSRIVHKAVVEVTKEGTEGAAATGVETVLLTVADEQEFLVDRPFIFVVRDGVHKIPILVGKVNDPSK